MLIKLIEHERCMKVHKDLEITTRLVFFFFRIIIIELQEHLITTEKLKFFFSNSF
jgi:hypothetical protein